MILASTSKYRKELLKRLGLPFDCRTPKFDEEHYKNKGLTPVKLAQFLAQKKAESISRPGICVIGADQLVAFKGEILGKPLNFEKAFEMLSKMSGKTHELITAVYVTTGDKSWKIVDHTRLTMRKLYREQIETYLRAETPYDCAGAYKIEKRGITLFEKIETHDCTAIQGLPLIKLTTVLEEVGIRR